MAYIPRSSFGQAPGVIPMQVKKKHTIRIVSVVGTILMSLAVLATLGAFIYKQYLDNQLQSAQAELNGLSDTDNEQKMHEIEVYDRKLSIAHNLLDNHLSPSRILAELEKVTKQTVRYQTFKYIYDPGFEAEVTLGGDTRALTSVALQKMKLLEDGVFSDFVLHDISTASQSNPDDIAETPQQNEEESNKDSLGVQFEVVGIFKKDRIEYTGSVSVPQEFTPLSATLDTTFASNTPPTSVTETAIDEVTPNTTTSNDETL